MEPIGGTRGIEAAMIAAATEVNAKIHSCHERVACPTCGAAIGERCWRKGAEWNAVPKLKHPHEARWTQEVPKR